jgi:hypothetical protein
MILPNAKLGVTHHLDNWFNDSSLRDGLELFTRDDTVLIHIWKDGAKFFTLELSPEKAERVAKALQKGATRIAVSGGSAPAPMPTVLHS